MWATLLLLGSAAPGGAAAARPRALAPRGAPAVAMRAPAAGPAGKEPAATAPSRLRSPTQAGSAARLLAPLLVAAPLFLHAAPAAALALPAAAEPVVRTLLDSPFFQALSLIFVSELGDKTFFIATILAAKTSRLLTFFGAASALAAMTVISVGIGQVFHAVPTGLTRGIPIDDIIAVVSFSYFGVKSLLDAAAIRDGDDSGMAAEQREAEEELSALDTKRDRWSLIGEAFALTFAAELGDRSQLTTIALSAAQDPLGVCVGAIIAHCIATGGAVLGGSFISKYLSEKVIGFIGGGLFLVFALTTFAGLVPQLATLAGL